MALPDWLKLIKGSMDDVGDEPVTLLLSALIGYDPSTGEGVDASMFGSALGSIPARKEVRLDINSLGGRIDQGMAMANMISARGNVTTRVIGYAASMGAMVFLAGKHRQMMPGTMVMIHNPMITVDGDHRDLEAMAALMKNIKSDMASLISSKTKVGKKQVSEMMDKTTYLDTKMALEMGFTDEVVDGSNAMNLVDPVFFLKTCQKFETAPKGEAPGGPKENQPKKMKLLTAALAAAGLIPSASLTEEGEITGHFNTSFTTFKNLKTDNETLTNRVKKFEDAQKVRVETMVNKAITDKLVKEDRKAYLTTMGMRDETELSEYLTGLTEAKGSAAGRQRGAPPAPSENTPEAKDAETEQKIIDLQAEMKKPGADLYALSTKVAKLKGRDTLFAPPAAKQ
jgi:ATP-dependent Clp protease protease subunit